MTRFALGSGCRRVHGRRTITLCSACHPVRQILRIEQHVHERMFLLRCRQLSHPELATEAMNLLARAFTCLIDPIARQAYDARLWGSRSPVAVTAVADAPSTVESVAAPPSDPLAWLFGPWSASTAGTNADLPAATVVENWVAAPPPLRSPMDIAPGVSAAPTAEERNGQSVPARVAAAAAPAPAQPPPEAPDVIAKAATSQAARQGLGTKRALLERMAQTRQLYRAWNASGKYLEHPERRLGKSAEAIELARQLTAIRRRLHDFPPLLGAAGQPGFYVVTLASQPRKGIVATFRMLLPSQREMLARDWRDGLRFLAVHRRFVREELKALRQTHWLGRAFRAVDVVLSDHPGWLLGAIVLVALAVATWLGLSQ